MIDVLFEQRVIQNPGLGAEVIWQAVQEAYESTGRVAGVPLPLIFLILPLTFHKRTATVLASKTQPGALYKALGEDRELTIGLQDRMQAMCDRTFQALSIGFQTDLLLYDEGPERQLIPGKKTAPVIHVTDDVKVILNAARRVGQAFCEMSIVQFTTQLNIRF